MTADIKEVLKYIIQSFDDGGWCIESLPGLVLGLLEDADCTLEEMQAALTLGLEWGALKIEPTMVLRHTENDKHYDEDGHAVGFNKLETCINTYALYENKHPRMASLDVISEIVKGERHLECYLSIELGPHWKQYA